MAEKTRYSDEELEEFRTLINQKLEVARQELELYRKQILKNRINNKTYGICKDSGKLISKERLIAVPHATQTIEAKNLRDSQK